MPRILKSKLTWAVAIVAALAGLYALVGYSIAPGIVRDQAVKFVRETYGRELQIGAVRIDPFKLQAEVRDLALPDADGRPMLAFRRLFVDFELASIWKRTLIFKDVSLEAPQVRAVIRPDGAINLLDLVPKEEKPAKETSELPKVWLQSFLVSDGKVEFADLERRRPFERAFTPVNFSLQDFRTTPEGGDFKLTALGAAGETFDWNGRFALAPVLASQGEFALGKIKGTDVSEYLGDALPFDLSSGLIGLAGSYAFSYDKGLDLEAKFPKIELAGLGLRARGVDTDWVKVPGIVLTDTAVALPEQTVSIAGITVSGLEAQAWMAPDGSINLAQLFAPTPASPSAPAAVAPSANDLTANRPAVARKTDLPNPWQVRIASVDVERASIDFEDRKIAPVTKFRLAPVNLHVKDASLDLSKPLPVTLDAVINDHAAFKADGTVTPDPLAADLGISLAKARMTILQPYVLPLADLTITGGELDVSGRVRLDPPDAPGPELSFDGDVMIDGFASVDNAMHKDLVNFRELKVGKIRYAMAPDSVNIDLVSIAEPFARVIISEERVINIAAVLDPKGTAEALAARRAAAAAESKMTAADKRAREREQKEAEKQAAKSPQVGQGATAAGARAAARGRHADPHPRGAHRRRHDGLHGPLRAAEFLGEDHAARRHRQRPVEPAHVPSEGRPQGRGRHVLTGDDRRRNPAVRVRSIHRPRHEVREHIAADLQSIFGPVRGLQHREGQAHHGPPLPDPGPQARRTAQDPHRPARVGRAHGCEGRGDAAREVRNVRC